MQRKIWITILFALSIVGCQRSTERIATKQPSGAPPAHSPKDDEPSIDTPPAEAAAVGFALPEAVLSAAGIAVAASQLTWTFSYLGKSYPAVGPQTLEFQAGKAEIKISDLPVGKAGDMVLEIQDASIPRLRGTTPNVALTAGANRVTIALAKIDSSNQPDRASVSIVAEWDGAKEPPRGPDPLASWDGKANLGNDFWEVIVGQLPENNSPPSSVNLGAKNLTLNNGKTLAELFVAEYLVIDISQANCGPCKTLAAKIKARPSLFTGKCRLVTLVPNVESWNQFLGSSDPHAYAAKNLNATAATLGLTNFQGTPHTLILDKNGKLLDEQVLDLPEKTNSLCQ